jgi:hypothetical protein
MVSQRDTSDNVCHARFELDLEVEPNKLARPLMLGDCGEALINQKLQAVMVCSDHEQLAPKVGTPMLHGLNESDQLTLVCGQFGVPWCHLLAEERHWPGALV